MSLSEETRKKFLAFMNEPTDKAHATKTRKEERAEFEKRFGARTPTSEIVEKILAAERIVWIPQAYVLLVRVQTCKNCKMESQCLESPRLFLQHRKAGKDESNSLHYIPVKEMEFKNLPKRKVMHPSATPFCLSCFETSSCPTNSSNSSQEDTASHTEKFMPEESPSSEPQMAPTLELLTNLASQFSSPSLSPVNSSTEESGGSRSERAFGSVCGEREFANNVTAEG